MTETPEWIVAFVKGESEANRRTGETGDDSATPLIGKIYHQMIMLLS